MQTNHRYYFIYKTTNLINGKFYIGMHVTNNLNDGYLGSGKLLHKAIKKYVKENFKKEIILFTISKELLIELEKTIVDSDLIKHPKCLNIMTGGHGGFLYLDYEERRRLSKKGNDALKFKLKNDKEFAKKFSELRKRVRPRGQAHHWFNKPKLNGAFGKNSTHSVETKKKIGEVNKIKQKGKLNSQYGTCWIYNLNLKENKKIKKEQLEEYLNLGWIKGLIKEFNKKVDLRISCRQFDL